MAKKRAATSETKPEPNKSAPKRAPKAGAAGRTKTTTAKAETATKTDTAATGAAGAAKKTAIKLTDKQRELLQKVRAEAETGYVPENARERRSLESLWEKKVVKKKAKDKETGKVPYAVTRAGEKLLDSAPTS